MKKRKRLLPMLLGLVLLGVGAGAAGYPLIRNQILEYEAGEEIENYNTVVNQENSGDLDEMLIQARDYNAALQQDGAVSVADYDDMLALTDAIGYLEIPKLGIYLPIYHGLEEEILQKGIGHIPETSLPVGGESTHCVLSGHSGLPAARILTELDQMEEGDRFYLHVLDETLAYEVDQIAVVLPEDSSLVQIEEGKDYVTLLTCTPYGVNTHRLLVRGERTEYIEETAAVSVSVHSEETAVSRTMVMWIAAMAAGVLILVAGIILVIRALRRK